MSQLANSLVNKQPTSVGLAPTSAPESSKEHLGFNFGLLSIELFSAHETHKLNLIAQQNSELRKALEKLEKLNQIISLVQQKTDDSQRISFQTEEERALLDDLREELPLLFVHGKYEWEGKLSIEALQGQLHDYVSGPLQSKINMITQQMALEQHELTEVMHVFQVGLERMLAGIRHILQNINKMR